MGRQQSFAKFLDTQTLISELNKYQERDTKEDDTYVIGIVQVIENTNGFKKGEYALVIGGERDGQRSPERLKESTGIENAERVVFIDCEYFWIRANGD